MKVPKIENVATKLRTNGYSSQRYQCKFCEKTLQTFYDDLKPIRAHMLKHHRMEYYATVEYIIEEEADHLWTAAK